MFDLALMFSGDDMASGCGWLSNPADFDPGGTGFFETRGGMRIFVDGSAGMKHQFEVEMVGERGVARIVDGGFEFELWSLDESSEFGHMVRRHLPANYTVGNPMLNAVEDLISSIESGSQPLSSAYDGRDVFEMIAAVHLAHQRQRAFVSFPLEEREMVIPSL